MSYCKFLTLSLIYMDKKIPKRSSVFHRRDLTKLEKDRHPLNIFLPSGKKTLYFIINIYIFVYNFNCYYSFS